MRRSYNMMIIVYAVVGILLTSHNSYSTTTETYTTKYVDGTAPITIDGNLSDWEWINAASVPITRFHLYSLMNKYSGPSDVSGVFRAFADVNYLYMAFEVKDDVLIFGEAPITKSYYDDCIEIFFYGDSNGLKRGQIFISLFKDGKTKIEGSEPTQEGYPYLWSDEQGTIAKLVTTNGGYDVEVAIPNNLFGLNEWGQGTAIGMNVRIYDDDEHTNTQHVFDTILQWADIIPHDPMHQSDPNNDYAGAYNPIVLNEVVELPSSSAETGTVVNVVLNGSQPKTLNELEFDYNVAMSYTQEWKNLEKAVKKLEELLKVSQGSTIHSKVQESLYEVLINLGTRDEIDKNYEDAIKSYEKVISSGASGQALTTAKLGLARNYFCMNDYEISSNICNELLKANIDSKTNLNAKMILLSINRKK